MKTKILSVFAALFTTVACADDFQYLYWMVDISNMDNKEQYAFSYATVSSGKTTFDLYDWDGMPMGSTKFGADDDTGYTAGANGAAIYAGDVSEYASSTFLFELYNENDEVVGWSSVSGASLASYIGGTMSQISTPYAVTSVIPEPTSGLLLLVGLAGLALKRKRV